MGMGLALLAAVAYASSAVLVRKKLGESSVLAVALIVTFAGNVILWPLAFLLTNLRTFNLEGILFFAIAGTLAPASVGYYSIKAWKVLGLQQTHPFLRLIRCVAQFLLSYC